MSLTNTYENAILNKLTGNEGDSWEKPESLRLQLYTSAPGENGDVGGLVSVTTPYVVLGTYDTTTTSNTFNVGPFSATYIPTSSEKFDFADTTSGDVTAIGLCDESDSVIWTEMLTGTAIRTYQDIDQLYLTKVVFGLTGTALCVDLCRLILNHLFIPGATFKFNEISQTYLAFYNGDPGFNGSDAPEVGSRFPMSDSDWTVANGTAYNTDKISHTMTSAGNVTHVALRKDATVSGSDEIYWRGALLSPQVLRANDLLVIKPGQLALAID